MEDFVKKKKISYTIGMDPKSDVARLYKVRGIPTVVAVDKEGRIVYYGHSIEKMAKKK